MSIKFQCEIKLPYIIRLKEAENYEFTFNFPEYECFKITFLSNEEENNDDLSEESCNSLLVELISKRFDYRDYKVNYVIINKEEIEYSISEVPYEVATSLIEELKPRLNEILNYIRNTSQMFWIEELPLNLFNTRNDFSVSYYFYTPNAPLSSYMQYQIRLSDYYMETGYGVASQKIYRNFFKDFDAKKESCCYEISDIFLDKAKNAVYKQAFQEAIIYAAIAQESFISKYIENNAPKNDIVFEKLNDLSGHLMDLKYNIILKYLKGTSLKDIDKGYWNKISGIYKLRNSIMHSGSITDKALEESGFAKVDSKMVIETIKVIRKTFDKIKAL